MVIYLLIDVDKLSGNKHFSLMFVDGDMWIRYKDKFLDGTSITPESVSRMVMYLVDHPMTSEVFRVLYIGKLEQSKKLMSKVCCGIGWKTSVHPDDRNIDPSEYSEWLCWVRSEIKSHSDDMIIYSYIDSLEGDFPWCMPAEVIKWWCDTAPQPT